MEVNLSYGGFDTLNELSDFVWLKVKCKKCGLDFNLVNYNPKLGIKPPYMEVNGVVLDFKRAEKFLNGYEKKVLKITNNA